VIGHILQEERRSEPLWSDHMAQVQSDSRANLFILHGLEIYFTVTVTDVLDQWLSTGMILPPGGI
jgi:hypothetical protein